MKSTSLPRLRRRDFITLLGGAAAAWPLAAWAQHGGLPVIALINGASSDASAANRAAFLKGLGELGYTEGQTVAVEYYWLKGLTIGYPP